MLTRYLDNIRRNHALEHATVSLLIARLGPHIRLVGRSSNDGFFIFGNVPGELVAECAREGLRRLQRGQDYWAVTPLCGTNIATAGILAGLSTMAVVQHTQRDRVGNAVVAGMLAVVLSQPIGRWLQKHVTTSPHLTETEIVSIETRPGSHFHKVKTRRVTA